MVAEVFMLDTISTSYPNSILGMHIFGCKFSLRTDTGDTVPDRKNFDSLLWAIVTVFQVSSLCFLQVGQGKGKMIRESFFSVQNIAFTPDSRLQLVMFGGRAAACCNQMAVVSLRQEHSFLPRRLFAKVPPVGKFHV